MSAFDHFSIAITHEAGNLIDGMQESDHALAQYSISKYLGHPHSKHPPERRQMPPHEAAVERLFFGFVEILESVKNLRNIPVYISRFPYRHAGIEKGAYLRYHVENYLNEIYLLRERMKQYLTVISRLFKADSRSREIDVASKAISKHFSAVLSGFTRIRGAHVHEQRHALMDQDFIRLGTFEVIRNESQAYASLYERTYREVRKAKRAWIERTNESIESLLNTYFEILYDLLFDEAGRLRNPAAPNSKGMDPAR